MMSILCSQLVSAAGLKCVHKILQQYQIISYHLLHQALYDSIVGSKKIQRDFFYLFLQNRTQICISTSIYLHFPCIQKRLSTVTHMHVNSTLLSLEVSPERARGQTVKRCFITKRLNKQVILLFQLECIISLGSKTC